MMRMSWIDRIMIENTPTPTPGLGYRTPVPGARVVFYYPPGLGYRTPVYYVGTAVVQGSMIGDGLIGSYNVTTPAYLEVDVIGGGGYTVEATYDSPAWLVTRMPGRTFGEGGR